MSDNPVVCSDVRFVCLKGESMGKVLISNNLIM